MMKMLQSLTWKKCSSSNIHLQVWECTDDFSNSFISSVFISCILYIHVYWPFAIFFYKEELSLIYLFIHIWTSISMDLKILSSGLYYILLLFILMLTLSQKGQWEPLQVGSCIFLVYFYHFLKLSSWFHNRLFQASFQ